MGALLGLLAALSYGVSDFLGGLGSRRLHFLWVAVLGHVVGVSLAWLSLLRFGGDGAATAPVLWGALSGIGSASGTLALYRGFSHGQMAVAAPLSAVGAAVIPALFGAVSGDRLPLIGVAGVVLALPAIWLMARAPSKTPDHVRSGVADGLASGAGFGLLFVTLDLAGDANGLWPVAAGQASAITLLLVTAAVLRPAWVSGVDRRILATCLTAGLLGTSANVLFFLATHEGLVTVAAVLTALYPGVTIGLAALLLHERPSGTQRLGLVLAAVAVVAIVTS